MEQFICKTCGKQFLSNSVNSYCRICYKKYREEREKKEEEAKNLKWQEQKKRNQALFEEEITKYSPALIENIIPTEHTLYIIGNAKQKIVYLYELNIRDDKSFEVIKDGVESVVDIDCETQLQCSRFRNIQDSLCGLDRNQYVWTKMGMAMTQGALPIMQQAKTEQSVNNGEQNLEKDF